MKTKKNVKNKINRINATAPVFWMLDAFIFAILCDITRTTPLLVVSIVSFIFCATAMLKALIYLFRD